MEYWQNVAELKKVEFEHKSSLVKGKPQLNWCDKAVQVGGEKENMIDAI